MFDFLISEKRKWIAMLAKGEPSFQLLYIIDEFFIKDNLDLNKYYENHKANSIIDGLNGLDYYEQVNSISLTKKGSINCTHTYRRYFSNNKLNRGEMIPDWFYIGYPDVALWSIENEQIIDTALSNNRVSFFSENKIDIEYFRFLIDLYLHVMKTKLECGKNS